MCAAAGTARAGRPRPGPLRAARAGRRSRGLGPVRRLARGAAPASRRGERRQRRPRPALAPFADASGRRATAASLQRRRQPVARAPGGDRRARHPGRHGSPGAGGRRRAHGAPRDRGPRAASRARRCARPSAHFRVGTARGIDDQEGRAVLLEERAGLLGPRRRKQLAARHRAVRAMLDGATFDGGRVRPDGGARPRRRGGRHRRRARVPRQRRLPSGSRPRARLPRVARAGSPPPGRAPARRGDPRVGSGRGRCHRDPPPLRAGLVNRPAHGAFSAAPSTPSTIVVPPSTAFEPNSSGTVTQSAPP